MPCLAVTSSGSMLIAQPFASSIVMVNLNVYEHKKMWPHDADHGHGTRRLPQKSDRLYPHSLLIVVLHCWLQHYVAQQERVYSSSLSLHLLEVIKKSLTACFVVQSFSQVRSAYDQAWSKYFAESGFYAPSLRSCWLESLRGR